MTKASYCIVKCQTNRYGSQQMRLIYCNIDFLVAPNVN